MDLAFVRQKFPGLRDDFIFMDNAGGSQVLGGVIERTADYLKNYCVQLGATYEVSANASGMASSPFTHISVFMYLILSY